MNDQKEITNQENSQTMKAGFNYEKMELSLEQMLAAGVHFGHKKSRWNPKMQPYIFTVRNNIHIIDLEKSQELLKQALAFIENIVKNGGKILFVGTKPQVKHLVKEIAEAVDMPYVDNRWLGGTFTNYTQIKKRIKYLNEQETKLERKELEKYTKYEQLMFKKEIERMNIKMGGIKKMEHIPQAVFITDMKESDLAVLEARASKVPVVGIVDTNIDPDFANFPIPANDDALSSLKYILGLVAKTISEAKKSIKVSENDKKPASKTN
jgi:small subunit ribosomal protein S2